MVHSNVIKISKFENRRGQEPPRFFFALIETKGGNRRGLRFGYHKDSSILRSNWSSELYIVRRLIYLNCRGARSMKVSFNSPLWPLLTPLVGLVLGCASSNDINKAFGLQDSYQGIIGALSLPITQEPGPIAFLSLTDSQMSEMDAPITFGSYYADSLASRLKQQLPESRVVERANLERVLEERGYNATGILTDEKLKNLQNLTPARYIFTGTYTVHSTEVELLVRLVDTRDATVASSRIVKIYLDNDVRKLLGLPPLRTWNTVADTLTQQVLEDVEGAIKEISLQKILNNISENGFDSEKVNLVEVAFKGKIITANQALRVVETITFDDGRVRTIKFLYPLIMDKENALELINTLSFQSSKDSVMSFMKDQK